MGDLSNFLEDAYLNSEGESQPFTIDRERQREVARQTLKEDPDYYSVHILAAAGLLGCEQLLVDTSRFQVTSFLRRAYKWRLKFTLPGADISEEDALALTAALHQKKNPALRRLSMALHQLTFGVASKIQFTCDDGIHKNRFAWSPEAVTLVETPKSSGHRQTVVELVHSEKDFGWNHLFCAARWSRVAVEWNGRELAPDYGGVLQRHYPWCEKWADPHFPLPWEFPETHRCEGWSACAYLEQESQGNQGMSLVVLADTVPVLSARLEEEELRSGFVPGFTLVVHSDRYQLDGSQRRVVKNGQLFRLIDEIMERVRSRFFEAATRYGGDLGVHLRNQAFYFQSMVSGERRAPKDDLSTDPYHFAGGYARPRSWDILADKRGLCGFSESYLLVQSLGSERPLRRVRSFRKPGIRSVSGHPHNYQTACIYCNTLIIRDEQSDQVFRELEIPGMREVFFTLDGETLILTLEGKGALRIWLFSTDNWELKTEPLEAEYYLELSPGYHCFVLRDFNNVCWVYQLDRSLSPMSVKLPEDTKLRDFSSDGRHALFSHLDGSILLDLQSGQTRDLQRDCLRFADEGRHLVSQVPSQLLNYTILELHTLALETVGKTRVFRNYSISSEGQISHGPEPCGQFPKDFAHYYRFAIPSYSPDVKLTDLRGGEPEELLSPLLQLAWSGPLPETDTVLLESDQSKWRARVRFAVERCHLTPSHLAWQTGVGVVTISRATGEEIFHSGRQLLGGLLAQEDHGQLHLRGLKWEVNHPLRVKNRSWEQHLFKLETVDRFQPFTALNIDSGVKAILCSETGERLFHTSGARIETNGQWAFKTKFSFLDSVPKLYVKELKRLSRWHFVGRLSAFALHPKKNLLYYLDAQSEVCIYSLDKQSGRIRESNASPQTELVFSPSGRYLAVKRKEGTAIHDAETLERLVTLTPGSIQDGKPEQYGPHYTPLWCNDEALIFRSSVWTADPQSGWKAPVRFPLSHRQLVMCDGESDLAITHRAGQMDLWSLSENRLRATVHLLGQDWFIFTPDGEWDTNLEEGKLEGITPKPAPQSRREGLLLELLRHSEQVAEDS